LNKDLVIEDKIVGVLRQRQRFQEFAVISAKAGVVLRGARFLEDILERRQSSIRDVLENGMPPRSAPPVRMRDPRGEY
jgi:hypothetical protein